MKRLRHVLFYIAGGLLLAAALAALGIHIASVRNRLKAEALLSAIRLLRVGESTLSTTQKLRIDFGARRAVSSPAEQSYQIIASNFSLENLKDRFPRIWRFGLRPSVFDVDLRYRGEKLIFVRYSIGSAVFTSSGKIEDLLAETIVEEDRGSEQQPTFRAAYRTRPALGGWANETQVLFGGLLTSKATPEEREAGFDFDLSCMSSFGGCQRFCELMPSVWRAAMREHQNKEISLPPELLGDPKCSPH
jgi:hypothetical protein